MPYPEALVSPMRQELVRLGVDELNTADEVEAFLGRQSDSTALVVINSICGCAAANARPAVAMAKQHPVQPDAYATVFAGQDMEATARLREHLAGIPPSSPFMVLLKEGEPVFVLERRHIEGRSASAIASDLVSAYDRFCGDEESAATGSDRPHMEDVPEPKGDLPPSFRSIL